jgi:hypothetical protein
VKRAKLVLAVSAVMLAIMVAYAAPALAAPDRDRFVSRDVEQEADSGDVDQSFRVSGGGDNSNQTVSTQGVANTGNAQNAIGVSDGFGGEDFFFCDEDLDGFCDDEAFFFDDGFFFFGDFDGDGFDDGFEFEDVGASIEVSPEQVVTSDQEVDQAATAFG